MIEKICLHFIKKWEGERLVEIVRKRRILGGKI